MENIFQDLEDTDVYIDGIGAFSTSLEHHTNIIDKNTEEVAKERITINSL